MVSINDKSFLSKIQLVRTSISRLDMLRYYEHDSNNENEKTKIPIIELDVKEKILPNNEAEVEVFMSIGDEKTFPFKIYIIQKGFFEIKGTIEQEDLSVFLKIQGLRLLWSFIRQNIYDLTVKAGVSPFMLPTTDAFEIIKSMENNKNEELDKED